MTVLCFKHDSKWSKQFQNCKKRTSQTRPKASPPGLTTLIWWQHLPWQAISILLWPREAWKVIKSHQLGALEPKHCGATTPNRIKKEKETRRSDKNRISGFVFFCSVGDGGDTRVPVWLQTTWQWAHMWALECGRFGKQNRIPFQPLRLRECRAGFRSTEGSVFPPFSACCQAGFSVKLRTQFANSKNYTSLNWRNAVHWPLHAFTRSSNKNGPLSQINRQQSQAGRSQYATQRISEEALETFSEQICCGTMRVGKQTFMACFQKQAPVLKTSPKSSAHLRPPSEEARTALQSPQVAHSWPSVALEKQCLRGRLSASLIKALWKSNQLANHQTIKIDLFPKHAKKNPNCIISANFV